MWFRSKSSPAPINEPEPQPLAGLRLERLGAGDDLREVAAFLRAVDGSTASDAEVAAEASRADLARTYLVLRDDQQRIAGLVSLVLPQVDHLDEADARIVVDTPLRRYGVGARLLELAEGVAREAGRTRLTGSFAFAEGSPSDAAVLRFVDGNGFRATQRMGIGIADVAHVAGAADPDGAEIRVWTDACPPELLVERAALQETFTAELPAGDGDHTQVWSAERLQGWFASIADGTRHLVEADAFVDGRLVGWSNVIVRDGQPQASQRDTYVVPDARGRGLAVALKAATARELQARHPHVTELRTFVDEGNAAMNAVNDRAGFASGKILFSVAKDLA